MLGRNLAGITFMMLEGKRIINYFLIFPFLDLIVQVGSKRSSRVPRFSNLLTHLNDLPRFDFYPTQMQIEGFDPQLWVINFNTIPV